VETSTAFPQVPLVVLQ